MESKELSKKFCCNLCPFIECSERDTCYKRNCYLDKKLILDYHCQYNTYPEECPVLKEGAMEKIEKILSEFRERVKNEPNS